MEKKQLTQKEELKQQFIDRLQLDCSVSPDEASDSQIYQVLSAMMVQRLKHLVIKQAYFTFAAKKQ